MAFAIYQKELAPGTRVSPILNALPPSSHSLPLGCLSTLAFGVLCHSLNSHWSCILHTVMYMFQCCSLKSSHPRLLPLNPKVCSLHLCLLCCPVCRMVSTVFLIPHMCINI